MLDATASGCINHPGVEAAYRCKQCGKPVCNTCVVKGPTGNFCGEPCKERHQGFIQRAQDMQQNSRRTGQVGKVRRFLIRAVIFLVAVCGLGFVALYFDIPVVAGLVRKALGFAAPYLP